MTACADGVPLRQCFDGVPPGTPQLRWMKVAVDWYRADLPAREGLFRNV